MEGSAFTVKGFLRNLFGWRGRLSRSGYWTLWLFVRFINTVLIRLFVRITDYSHHWIFDVAFLLFCLLWYIATYFALLFAEMRRYHDSGNSSWQALILTGSVGCALGEAQACSGSFSCCPASETYFQTMIGNSYGYWAGDSQFSLPALFSALQISYSLYADQSRKKTNMGSCL